MGVFDKVASVWSLVIALWNGNSIRDNGQVGDGREENVLKTVLAEAEKGNPKSVLEVIDRFANRSWLMNVGDEKGEILEKTVVEANPTAVLELGAYIGYSATLISSKMPSGSKLVSLEMNPANADITRQVVAHAGLSDKVSVVQGILSGTVEEVKRLLHEAGAQKFDVVFIDHDKTYYLSDLLILKEHGLVGKGTVLFADNMIIPGSPEYRQYMDTHKDEYDTVEIKTRFEYASYLPDSVVISTCK